jgi:hypothetical protein
MNINLNQIVAAMLMPVTDFLKKQGIWDILVKIYEVLSGIISSLWSWLGYSVDTKRTLDFLVIFLKFVLNIFLTLFDVLSKIVTWLLQLFK